MISELFSQTSEINSKKKALISSDGIILTYEDLYKKVLDLAIQIQKAGISPSSIIAIYMARSVDMIVAILASIISGCIYLPIDIRNPKIRVQRILEDAKPACIFIDQQIIQHLDFNDQDIFVNLQDINFVIFHKNMNSQKYMETGLLYLIYTSGSTGKPKGVLGTNIGLVNRIEWMSEKYPLNSNEKFVLNSPAAFVDAVFEIFYPLLNGEILYVPNDYTSSDPIKLADYVFQNEITRLVLGPTILSAMLDHVQDIKNKLHSINILTLSGQELHPSLINQFRTKFQNTTLLNLYGSTEVSADALYYEIPKDNSNFTVIPIGQPIKNVDSFIMDEEENIITMPNIPGEICISGTCLAHGYLNNEILSYSSGFTSHPNILNLKIYRMGDLGYIDNNNNFIYSGRIDGQYKVNGQRINRSEVEKAATAIPNVLMAALIEKDSQLLLYVKISKSINPGISKSEIMGKLTEFLPTYMLPNKIIILDSLPFNPNKKIDYSALKELSINHVIGISNDNLELNEHEKFLVQIFYEILKLDSVPSRYDKFFELGGSSLSAYLLISKIQTKYKIFISLNELYQNPAPVNISRIIEGKINKLQDPHQKIFCEVTENKADHSFILFPSILGSQGHFRNLLQKFNNINSYEISCNYNSGINYKDIEDLSNLCSEYIQQEIPETIVFLVGWSFGGVIAYDTAVNLEKSGVKIGGLILLDSYNPRIFSNMCEEEEKNELYNIMFNANSCDEQHKDINYKIIDFNISKLWKYKSDSILKCPAILIKAKTYNGNINTLTSERNNGWEYNIDNLKIYEVDSDHFDMLTEKNVGASVNILMETLHILQRYK